MLFFRRSTVDEHSLISTFDEAVSALDGAWNRFDNCPQNEVDQAIFALKVAEGEIGRITRKAKELGIKAISIKTRFDYGVRW